MFSDSICIIHWCSLWGVNHLTSRWLCSDEHILITSSPVALRSWWAGFVGVGPMYELRSEPVPCPQWLWAVSGGAGGVSNNTSTAAAAGLLVGVNVWTNGLLPSLFSENIFTWQPSYFSDLDETLPTVLQVWRSCLAQIPSGNMA